MFRQELNAEFTVYLQKKYVLPLENLLQELIFN